VDNFCCRVQHSSLTPRGASPRRRHVDWNRRGRIGFDFNARRRFIARVHRASNDSSVFFPIFAPRSMFRYSCGAE